MWADNPKQRSCKSSPNLEGQAQAVERALLKVNKNVVLVQGPWWDQETPQAADNHNAIDQTEGR